MTHHIIQYGVHSGRDVVEGPSHIEQVLVDGVVMPRRRAVDEEQALEVERRPAHEEGYHHRRWNKWVRLADSFFYGGKSLNDSLRILKYPIPNYICLL